MAVEVVLITPVLVAFLLLVVAFGRYVSVRGEVEAASRDAARAASLERSPLSAEAAANRTVQGTLANRQCTQVQLTGAFVAGGTITATLRCQIPLTDLGLLGLPGTVQITGISSAPLDLYRRTG
jgi:Flp pilus assembly protein TadG